MRKTRVCLLVGAALLVATSGLDAQGKFSDKIGKVGIGAEARTLDGTNGLGLRFQMARQFGVHALVPSVSATKLDTEGSWYLVSPALTLFLESLSNGTVDLGFKTGLPISRFSRGDFSDTSIGIEGALEVEWFPAGAFSVNGSVGGLGFLTGNESGGPTGSVGATFWW